MKGKLFIVVLLLTPFLFCQPVWASVDSLQGTWYGGDRVMEIWWCPERGAWRFEVRSSNMGPTLASGTVEESVGMSGPTYVFVTEDSRIFQASYDGSCSLSIGQLGNFTRADCSNGNNDLGGTGVDFCADAGIPWDNQQQPGMYVSFYESFSQCNYELFIQDQLIDTGTVQIQGNRLLFISQNGRTTEGQIIDSCSFRWGEAGVFQKEDCGDSGDWGSGSGGDIWTPSPTCEPLNVNVPGPAGGALYFQGERCVSQSSLSGRARYANYTMYSYFGPISINGEVQLYVQTQSYQWYWQINGGPVYYNIPGYGTFEVYFNNVEFLTDYTLYPLQAAGYLYINGQTYQVTPDMFSLIFGI